MFVLLPGGTFTMGAQKEDPALKEALAELDRQRRELMIAADPELEALYTSADEFKEERARGAKGRDRKAKGEAAARKGKRRKDAGEEQ